MRKLLLRAAGCLVTSILGFCGYANASTVSLSVTALSGGSFQYGFNINNTGGSVPMAGLLVEGGNTVFGLDLSSTISAPPGWEFLAPLPPFDDLLSYFSLASASDIPIGGSLNGFTFDSLTDPTSLSSVTVVLVGNDSSQFPITITPEPATMAMVFLAASSGILSRRFLRSMKPT